MARLAGVVALGTAMFGALAAAEAQQAAGRPAAGITEAANGPVTQFNEFLGRNQATQRVNVGGRVTGFLEKRNFVEGAQVKTGDMLYELERGPFEADLESKKAQVAQLQATLVNAKLTTGRAKALLGG